MVLVSVFQNIFRKINISLIYTEIFIEILQISMKPQKVTNKQHWTSSFSVSRHTIMNTEIKLLITKDEATYHKRIEAISLTMNYHPHQIWI